MEQARRRLDAVAAQLCGHMKWFMRCDRLVVSPFCWSWFVGAEGRERDCRSQARAATATRPYDASRVASAAMSSVSVEPGIGEAITHFAAEIVDTNERRPG